MLNADDATLDKIIREFGRTKKSLDEDVEAVEKWLKDQPHLPPIIDTRCIQNFLILNKFSVEKTKEKIDAYCTVRSEKPEIFGKIDPKISDIEKLTDTMYFVVHPQLFDNHRVFFLMLRNVNLAEELEPYSVFRYGVRIFEIRVREDVVNGDILIVKCDGFPLSFFLKLTPTLIYKFVISVWGRISSFHLKGIYFINLPPFAEIPMALLKKLLKPKVFEKIHFLLGVEDLKKYFPVDFLPEEFGGKMKCLDTWQEMLNEEIQSHQELFEFLDGATVDEKLRPESLKNDVSGCYGNFKKLEVD